jgi:hypothetical protein
MTLSTNVFIHDQIDPKLVFDHCALLIGAPEDASYKQTETSINMAPGQGFRAWLLLSHNNGQPIKTDSDACDEYCDDPCDQTLPHDPAHWVKVDFDTAYGYRGDDGEGCGDLHAKLVAQLGKWLDSRGVEWSWENEFTGEIHKSYSHLGDLCSGGQEASAWFMGTVLPVIAAEYGAKKAGL